MRHFISWTYDAEGLVLGHWRVYASDNRATKGSLVATVPAAERWAEWEGDEGVFYIRCVPVTKDGIESPWQNSSPVEAWASGRNADPGTPDIVGAAQTDQTMLGRVVVDPPAPNTQPHVIEVIEGPDEYRGILRAVHEVRPRGPILPDGARGVSVTFPLEGHSQDKTLNIRRVSVGGRPGTAVVRTARAPALTGWHHIAIVNINGSTHTGLAAAAATDGWEYDATDGLRLRTIGASNGLTGGAAGWGKGNAGLFVSNHNVGPYVDNAIVESDEVDLGATMTFRLQSSLQVQRKTTTGALHSKPAWWWKMPAIPAVHDEVRRRANGLDWVFRESRGDSKPRQPLRAEHCRVEYVAGTASPVDHASSDYIPHVEGQWLRARYIRVRLCLAEPTAHHQLIIPTGVIEAHVQRAIYVGTGSPESSVEAPPGSRYVRTNGPPNSYVKLTGVSSTGWAVDGMGTSQIIAVRAVATAPTLTVADAAVMVDTTTGSLAVNLPSLATVRGQVFTVKKMVAANTLTLTPNGADTIDGAATLAWTARYETHSVLAPAAGTDWAVLT